MVGCKLRPEAITRSDILYLALGVTLLYGLSRYVRPLRVGFFSCLGHKLGIDYGHFGYK